MTITTTAPTIDATGIHAPTYADVLDYLQTQYRAIYGQDTYLEPDSKDGQFLAIIAAAINDGNSVSIAIYNSFSPATAQYAALSSNVKINGIRRHDSSYSTSDVLIVGQAGTTITNGLVQDANQVNWALPVTVNIPPGGGITVTATCTKIGAIEAPAGTITKIMTPALGWQTVTNQSDAAPGAPVETDAALRARQTTSTAIPSLTVFEGTIGAVANVPGVTRYAGYENDTNATDANGLPAHSIALVVEGGDATAIANAIAAKKGPGGGTTGTTAVTVNDVYGRQIVIRFYRPTNQAVSAVVRFNALAGFTTAISQSVQQAISDYINSIAIGGGLPGVVEWDACIAAAKSVPGGNTFKIVSLALTGPAGPGSPDVPLAFNQAAMSTPASITMTPV
ncbi:baseplate J/gp47 family protein [Pandoraea communis]|uniref:baseplate J/gp47 family protein n=1 Tax=Pandoraea communis TaxID=2508297 RepID=UPI0025A68E3A|nr:baseplate J/gp47 family protein [Pandoraea communis]MDM8357466.1 baseplate J/gp47 family protein [Pandoraea communis]